MNQKRYESGSVRSTLRRYVLFKIVGLAVSFLCQILVVKALVPAEYATYAILLAAVMAGERLLSFGVDRVTSRFVPELTRLGDVAGLRAILARVVLIRTFSIGIFICAGAALVATNAFFAPILPIDGWTCLGFSIWFVSWCLTIDADVFAQSWLVHSQSTIATFGEVVCRTIVIALAAVALGSMSASVVVWVSAITQAGACAFLLVRDHQVYRSISADASPDPDSRPFDARVVLGFALANYASSVMYLVSSPPVVRLVASRVLPVLDLAAYSFVQALALSLQRLLPGMSILPSLEPFVMGKVAGDNGERLLSALSLVFKVELIVILAGIVVACLFGQDVILILSRQEYAPFYWILPVLLVYVSFATSYRLVEIVLNAHLKHRAFFWVWPIGLISTAILGVTSGWWGIWPVLIVPLVEIAVRVIVLSLLFNHLRIARVFDLSRTLLPVVSALGGVVLAQAIQTTTNFRGTGPDLAVTIATLVWLFFALTLVRPFRKNELEWLALSVPSNLRGLVETAGLRICR